MVAMGQEESSKKRSRPQVVKLDKAFKLAEKWVSNMSKSSEEELTEVEIKGRPSRLGLGAAVPRLSKFVPSNDPVERKLRAKLDAERKKVELSAEDSAPSARNEGPHEDSDDEELESRTNAFARKRVGILTSPLQAKKKQK